MDLKYVVILARADPRQKINIGILDSIQMRVMSDPGILFMSRCLRGIADVKLEASTSVPGSVSAETGGQKRTYICLMVLIT